MVAMNKHTDADMLKAIFTIRKYLPNYVGVLLRTTLFWPKLPMLLIHAAGNRDCVFVTELLDYGFSFPSSENRRAIWAAAKVADAKMLDLLLQSQNHAMIKSLLSEFRDVLMMATLEGCFDLINLLLETDFAFTNYEISGAMDAAADANDPRILDLFLKTQSTIPKIEFCARHPDV